MEQLKESVAQMEVDEGQEWQQRQHRDAQREEASETVGEENGGAVGGGVLETLRRKISDMSKRIGERLLMRSRVSGEIRLVGEKDKKEEGEEVVKLEEVVGVSDVVELVIEEGVEATEVEEEDTGSVSSKGLGSGYAFLDAIEEDKRDEEVEKKKEERRKRKSEDSDRMLRVKGLKVMPGWAERAKESRENPIWCRKVESEENGSVVIEKKRFHCRRSTIWG